MYTHYGHASTIPTYGVYIHVWLWRSKASHLCCTCMTCNTHTPGHPSAADEPGIGRNVSCALGDCLTSRPKGRSRPRELWFLIYSCICTCTVHVHVSLKSTPYEVKSLQSKSAVTQYMGGVLQCTQCGTCWVSWEVLNRTTIMYMYIHVLYVRQQTGEEQRRSQVDHVAIRDYVQMALECPFTCTCM